MNNYFHALQVCGNMNKTCIS